MVCLSNKYNVCYLHDLPFGSGLKYCWSKWPTSCSLDVALCLYFCKVFSCIHVVQKSTWTNIAFSNDVDLNLPLCFRFYVLCKQTNMNGPTSPVFFDLSIVENKVAKAFKTFLKTKSIFLLTYCVNIHVSRGLVPSTWWHSRTSYRWTG